MRRCGVLMPISSIPTRFGIGGFSKEAYDFVDFLAASGQSLWQILPLGPTGYGDSPYQSFSTFAGNPYYICLDRLIDDGLLTEKECLEADFGDDAGKVDYEKIYNTRFALLRKAFDRSNIGDSGDYRRFVEENSQWLKDYAMYLAVKDSLDGISWIEWDEGLRLRKPEVMATGQLWGNPLYRWEYHEETGFAWWIRRLAHCFKLYDVVRIDHFRGFDEYWSIPYGDATAQNGVWKKGPGYKLFETVKKALGNRAVIAEDLGFLTPGVLKLVKKTGYPGMKVLQFAFDSREESDYLPYNYPKNCVVYTGTHDNDTVNGWITAMSRKDLAFAKKYLGVKRNAGVCDSLIRAALGCVADTAVIPIQDYLELGGEARINTPSTLGGNWEWRMESGACTQELSKHMLELARLYGRAKRY